MAWMLYVAVFLYGIVFGSFLNVCIYRIPKKESIVTVGSHCMSCGYSLKWYDLVPLFSWLFLGGKCRKCKAPISPQYPIVEGLNGLLYVLIFWAHGFCVESVLYCFMTSALLALSVIDFRTYIIPFGFNVFIFVLGVINVAYRFFFTEEPEFLLYLIGFFAVSAFTAILYYASKGRAIGGGDVKLMAAAGLLLGWKLIILAFLLGCVLGSVIHITRMKLQGADRVLAMGPYLSAGIFLSALWGNAMIDWYLGFLGR